MKNFFLRTTGFWVIMATLLLVLFAKCADKKPKAETHYLNAHFIVREKGVRNARSVFKFFLIQNVEDTTVWGEYFGLGGYGLSNAEWYNKEVGDTLWFMNIRKDRFFHKIPRK